MGVDICTHRARIGLFQLFKCDQKKPKYNFSRYKESKWNISSFLLLMSLAASISIASNLSPLTRCHNSNMGRATSSLSPIQKNLEFFATAWQQGLRGFPGVKTNKICHMTNGNRRPLGHKISAWNCGRGLMSKREHLSDKILDIKLFIEENKPSVFGIIESDIHGCNSPSNRKTTFTKQEILDQLHIEGYTILLPDTWELYDQARLIVFARDDIKIKKRENPDFINDLPSITLEVGIGREKRTLVNFYYREWTSGVTGDNTLVGQLDRFSRQVQYWKSMQSENRDIVLIGDANYCSLSCSDPEYPAETKSIANLASDFFLEESMTQLIDQFTRTELRGNIVQKSCIDHITTNVPGKCKNTAVLVGGNSDHLAVTTMKLSKEIVVRPAVIKKRSYKYFVKEDFLREVRYTDFSSVIHENDVDVASELFSKIFGSILDNHAPIKIFQTRKNYAPWLSDATKEEIIARDRLKKESIESNDPEVLKKYKILRNKIKSKLPGEERMYYENKFNNKDITTKEVWKTAYEILDQNKDLSPKQLFDGDSVISAPKKLAEAFNNIFLNKVKKLKNEVTEKVFIEPVERLRFNQFINYL